MRSDTACVVCGQVRGFIYVGPTYSEEEYLEEICPWCIADGTAHALLNAEFTDANCTGDGGHWSDVPVSVREEVLYRTPGFNSWQAEEWFIHCNDVAAFLGRVGHQELEALDIEAIQAIQDSTALEGNAWQDFYLTLDKDGSPTSYIFRCLHCGTFGGYTDCD